MTDSARNGAGAQGPPSPVRSKVAEIWVVGRLMSLAVGSAANRLPASLKCWFDDQTVPLKSSSDISRQ